MTADLVIELLQRMLTLALMLSAPILAAGLLVGLAVAVFQAATQIQESALSFVPKMIAVGAVLAFMGSWGLQKLVIFTRGLISDIVFLGTGGI